MLVLVPELQRVVALDPGVIDLGIEQRRILPLGIRALPAESGKAGNADRGQASGHNWVGRQPGNREGVVADGEGKLARLGAGEADAGVQNPAGAEEMRVAEGHLLVQNPDRAIALTVQRKGNRRIVDAGFFAVTDTEKPRTALAL